MINKLKLSLWLIPVLFFTGCINNQVNPNIAQIDQQASTLRNHIYEISGDDGYYHNENIDFALIKRVKDSVGENLKNILVAYNDQKLEYDIYQEGLDKSISLMYFCWIEQADAARRNNDLDNLNFIREEEADFSSQEAIQKWIDENGKREYYKKIENYFSLVPELISKGSEIDANNQKLNELKTQAEGLQVDGNIVEYNLVADEYNALLEQNNQMIDEYNTQLEEIDYENVFNNFMKFIDVSYIFPGQDTIPLAK